MGNEQESSVRVVSLQSITRGASLFVVGKILLDVLKFLLNAALTRALASSLYGVFAYANTLLVIALVFTNLGSDNSLVKYVPQYEDDERKQRLMVGLAYLTSFVASFVVAGALFLLAPLITQFTLEEPLLTDVLRLFSVLLIFDTLVKVLTSTFRSLERLEYQVLVRQIARPTARLIAVVAALAVGLSFYGVMASLVVASVVTFLLALGIFLSRIRIRPALRPALGSRSDVLEYYNFSIPLLLKDTGAILRRRIDVLMVGFFLSSTAVGIYNVSLLVAGLLGIPLAAFNQLFPPVASRLYANGDLEDLDTLYGIVTRWVFTMTLFLAITVALYRTEILSLFGPEFVAGAAVLVFFVLARVLSNGVGPAGYLLMVSEHQYVLLGNQWVFGVLNVAANYVFIMEFGLVGAAVATATVNGVNNVARLLEIWYLEGLFPYSRSFLKPIFAGVGAGGAMYGVSLYASGFAAVVGGCVVGVVSYAGLLAALGVEQEDKEFLREAVASSVRSTG